MDRILKKSDVVSLATGLTRPSREEAEAAVRTLIGWTGDDPDREGLLGTPDRVVRAYEEFFSGYDDDPREMLQRTFEEVEGYDEVVALRDIRLESHCEHHMVPIIGKVHVGYLPDRRVSASASSPAWSTPTPIACRSRRSSRHRSPTRCRKCCSHAVSPSSSRRRTNA